MLQSIPVAEASTVRALKQSLQSACGVPRFRQRIVHDGVILVDDFKLEGPLDLQIVLLNFITASPSERSDLLSASTDEDNPYVEEMLQRPQDPNRHPDDDMGALSGACTFGRLGNMQLLLEARAELEDASGSMATTALHIAAWADQVGAVRLLLSSRANTEARAHGGHTALWKAALVSSHSVQVLLDAGAEIDSANDDGETPLGVACRRGHVDVVRTLLTAGAKPALRDKQGRSNLEKACGRERFKIRMLLSKYKWSRTKLQSDKPKAIRPAVMEA